LNLGKHGSNFEVHEPFRPPFKEKNFSKRTTRRTNIEVRLQRKVEPRGWAHISAKNTPSRLVVQGENRYTIGFGIVLDNGRFSAFVAGDGP